MSKGKNGPPDFITNALEEEYRKTGGQIGAIYGCSVITEFSKEALIGVMAIMMRQHRLEEESHKQYKSMMDVFRKRPRMA